MIRTALASSILLLTVGATGCDFETETFKHAPSPSVAATITKVITTNDVGDITIRPSSAEQPVLVTAEAEWLTERPAVVFNQEGTTLFVAASCIDSDPLCKVDISLEIPARMAYELHGVKSNITASSLDGAAVLSNEEGDVVLDNLSGSVDLKAGEGEVLGNDLKAPSFVATMKHGPMTLSFTGGAEVVSIRSDAGALDLVVPPTAYQIDASTGSGELAIAVPESAQTRRKLTLNTRRGNIEVRPQSALIHEPIDIKVGQTIRFADDSARLVFDGVVEDTRCPIKATCTWGGRFIAAMTLIMKDGARKPFELSFGRPTSLSGYSVQLMQALPFMTQGDTPPADADYVLTFVLERV